jgi:hypothetical protein
MQKNFLSREDFARLTENYLTKFAGVIRNLLLEGKTLGESLIDPRAKFWMDKTNELQKKYPTPKK